MRSLFLVPIGFLVSQSAFAWSVDKTLDAADTVKVESHGKAVALSTSEPLKLLPGYTVITTDKGKAHFTDGESEMWMAPSTRLVFEREPDDDKDEKGRFEVKSGELRVHFKRPSGPGSYPYEVKTRSLVASVRGTQFIIDVGAKDEKICTLEGLVRVSSLHSAGESWDVPADKGLFVVPREMPKVKDVSKEQRKKWVDATTL